MMAGQVPVGALMDRVGTRIGLASIFVAWSVIGGAHAFASGLAAFVVLRFLMGLSECGNYTAGIKAIAGLFPSASRSTAGGIFNAGAQLGSVIATPLIVFIATTLGWRMAFVLPAAVGLIWLAPWLMLYPRADGHAAARSAGSAAPVRFADLLRSRKVLGLFLIRVFSGPVTTLYWAWLPLYLRTGRNMSFVMIGMLGWLPNLFGMTGNVVGGVLTDRLVRMTGSPDRGRKLAFTAAFGLSALSMTMPFVANDYAALALMGLALFGNQWVAAVYIGTVGDVVPPHLVGRVNGIAGFGDSSSVLVAQLLIGALVDRYSFTPVFIGAGLFPILALLSVIFVLGRIEPATFPIREQPASAV
jgi:ACS family hexuronate transporter-like MFS transporter